MAPVVIATQMAARDGLGRTAASKVAGREVRTPAVVQVLSAFAPAVGAPQAVLVDAEGANAPEGSLALGWAASPLFPEAPTARGADILLPRPVPRAYAVAPLIEPEELALCQGPVAGALASSAGAGHLAPLARDGALVALLNLTDLRGRPREFVRALAGARQAVGPRPLLFAAGVADPASVALMVALGADLVDDFQALRAASAGDFLYTFGSVRGGLAGACSCPACEARFARPLAGDQGGAHEGSGGVDEESLEADHDAQPRRAAARSTPAVPLGSPLFKAALEHNRRAISAEAAAAGRAVARGTLRELVETRVRARPWLVAALRNFDREFYAACEALTPVWKARLHALSHESLHRAEVVRWGERLKDRYKPPPSAAVLLIAPCAARKPYSQSQTHRSIDRALSGIRPAFAVHRVVATSPLGIVPQELERVFPAAHYDIPVTGDWTAEETRRVDEQLACLVKAHKYRAVVSLVGDDLPALQDTVDGLVECAAKGRPWDEALDLAAKAVRGGLAGVRDVDPKARTLEDLHSIARFQFGEAAADALLAGAQARGRWPWNRLVAGRTQVAQHVPDRGRLALTLEGARRVASARAYRVEAESFALKGDLFAVGVRAADPEVRAGDSVAVLQGGAVTAAGFARMCALEMLSMKRGAAVDVRHKAGGG